MKCKNCGNELKQGTTFCGQCGTKVESESVLIDAKQLLDKQPPKLPIQMIAMNSKMIGLGVFIIVALFCGILIFVNSYYYKYIQ